MIATPPTRSGSDAATRLPNTSTSRMSVIGIAIDSARARSDSTVLPTSSNTASRPPSSTVNAPCVAGQLVADRGERVLDLRVGAVDPREHERGVAVLAAQRRRRAEVPVGADDPTSATCGEAVGEREAGGRRGRAVDVAVGRGREEHDVRVAPTELVGEHVLGPARFGLRVVEAAALQAVEHARAEQRPRGRRTGRSAPRMSLRRRTVR